jgi:hypothetical protein
MSSPSRADCDALPYAQRLHAVLHGRLLPPVINLGIWNYNADKRVEQEDFKAMTAEEVLQLALRLQAQPHVTHLNLSGLNPHGHNLGIEGIRMLVGSISMQRGLRTLYLGCT